MIFNPKNINYKITMNNDPIEAVEFAAFYLYGQTEHLDPDQAEHVKELLMQQKPWVTAYANFRGDYFLATTQLRRCRRLQLLYFPHQTPLRLRQLRRAARRQLHHH